MTSDKKSIALITEIFVKRGGKHIVISPGSRNAPVIISFAHHPEIKAYSVVDERGAAFFALGIAQQTGKPVALSCTSGTAVLNYAPAIAEAYYQKIPLLILTADRPPHLIDQADGQTIRQKNVYKNFIKADFEIPENWNTDEEQLHYEKIIHEAITIATKPKGGPVHINLPFYEPLYNQVENKMINVQTDDAPYLDDYIQEIPLEKLKEQYHASKKKLLIVGMKHPDQAFNSILRNLSRDPSLVILAETTANVPSDIAISGIDKVITSLSEEEKKAFKPDLLMSCGGPVVSKMIKSFIRGNQPQLHWHFDMEDDQLNTYQCLSHGFKADPKDIFPKLIANDVEKKSDYKSLWWSRYEETNVKHQQFISVSEYSDLQVFDKIFKQIPPDSHLHLANSTPVRYAQLFKDSGKSIHFSNRGTSGIDGSLSTAMGAAFVSKELTTLITGDLGFFYDSNALLFQKIPPNLRIIIINNGGGGIFRFIPGPDTTGQLETFFESRHQITAEHHALSARIKYFKATDIDETEKYLEMIFLDDFKECVILEIFTPTDKNGEILRSYFNYLKTRTHE